ncbi:MAG: T9SS type A sorting domain-containing protein [Ignavibacteriae bacterium]|nr:T9SS type A sorting domain-containing protein [Ignavibacteriota bacterium]
MHTKLFLIMLVCLEAAHAQNFWEPVLPSVGYVVNLAANSQGHLFAASYTSGVYRSTDGGTTWVQVNSGLMFSSALGMAVNPLSGDLFVSSGARIYRSTTNGENWVAQDSTTFLSGAWRLVVNNQGILFAAPNSSDSLRRSSDDGLTWRAAHNGLPQGGTQELRIHANGDIYICMRNNWVFRSSDNGENWTALPRPFPPLPYVDADAIAFGSGSEIYVGDDGWGFFKSTDGGSSWEQLNSGLPNQYVWALAVSNRGHLFAGLASDGVYRSTDGGAQWDSVNTGLGPSRRIYSFLIASSGYLFTGTISGLFRSTQPVTDVEEDLNNVANQYVLFQNYPNPFNPKTSIKFKVQSSKLVTLRVYNVLGQEVATLVNEELQPGSYEVAWDARLVNGAWGLASGVYLYRLTVGSFSETKKFLLLR